MKQPLLIEIGVEELPSSHLKLVVETLKKSLPEAFKKARLGFEGLEVYGTPRRLVIFIKELETRQNSQEIQIVGPAKAAALDAEGKPTQSYLGFLKSQKADEKEVSFREVPNKKGEYLVIERMIGGEPAKKLLPDLIKRQIAQLSFTRKMRWEKSRKKGEGAVFFSRPVRWLLAFYGETAFSLNLGSVRSASLTFGHRLLHPKPLKVKNTADYFQKMKEVGIVLDPRQRQDLIREQLKKRSSSWQEEEAVSLVEEVANLVEIPFFFEGKLSRQFLGLPEEVLAASMAKYQRVFPLKDEAGKLKSSFLGVLNGKPSDLKKVIRHYEWVLNARLEDSLFFFNEDRKVELASKRNGLKELKFHEKLGTFYDKSLRLEKFCRSVVKEELKLDQQDVLENISGAALDSKCDLLTKMVYEFPSLQGVMGHRYLLLEGKPIAAAQAVEEQYQPKGSSGSIPVTLEGTILALAERLDTLVGFFGIGVYPTGSEDPFGLRRAATGMIRILLEGKLPLSIDNLIDRSISSYESAAGSGGREELKKKVSGFLKERLNLQLKEIFRPPELVEAVIRVEDSDIIKIWKRLSQLSEIEEQSYFRQAAKIQERTQNILKPVTESLDHEEVKEALFTEQAEKELWKAYQDCRKKIVPLIEVGEFRQATKVYGWDLFDPVHAFFDQVLVNTEDAEVRKNRLKLCHEIYQLYAREIADLSRFRFE